jgi:hypothetical protein
MPVIDVRCPSLAVITSQKGEIALLQNRGKRKHKNEIIYTPPGGGTQVHSKGFKFLRSIGAHDFKKFPDMRFKLPESSLNKLAFWFCEQRKSTNPEREIDAARRETYEELCDEEHILLPNDFKGVSFQFLGFGFHRAKNTVRIADIFQTTFQKSANQKLIRASEGQTSLLRFVTKAEIHSGWTRGKKYKIGEVSSLILHPQRSILL